MNDDSIAMHMYWHVLSVLRQAKKKKKTIYIWLDVTKLENFEKGVSSKKQVLFRGKKQKVHLDSRKLCKASSQIKACLIEKILASFLAI